MLSDPIADFLTRIKNGYLARQKVVVAPYSKIKEAIAKILVKENYLKKYQVKSRTLELELKYQAKQPAVTEIKRFSKPSLRRYAKANQIPKVRQGWGITILTTSQGVMTNKEAKKKNLGGEIIGQVW